MPFLEVVYLDIEEDHMQQPKVIITRRILEQGLEIINQHCEPKIWPGDLPPTYQELKELVKGVDGILCLLTDRIDAEIMDLAGKNLKVISNHAVGYDNIDITAATMRKIPVGNTPGILTEATADFTFALLLASARRLPEASRYVLSGKWQTWSPDLLLGADLSGATLGIIGFGRIGQAVARRASGFNLRIIYFDPAETQLPGSSATSVSLEQLLRESDFVSLHTPLTPETHHLMNPETFSQMKENAILINTSRGGVIDQQALYLALKNHQISGAALDVTDPEPIPPDSPLLTLENLIICPHIASASRSTRSKMSLMAAENLIAGLQGQRLPHCVNPQVYS